MSSERRPDQRVLQRLGTLSSRDRTTVRQRVRALFRDVLRR